MNPLNDVISRSPVIKMFETTLSLLPFLTLLHFLLFLLLLAISIASGLALEKGQSSALIFAGSIRHSRAG